MQENKFCMKFQLYWAVLWPASLHKDPCPAPAQHGQPQLEAPEVPSLLFRNTACQHSKAAPNFSTAPVTNVWGMQSV